MFKFNPSLPLQLRWEHAGQPELLAWTIRARNYNTSMANCAFAFMAVLILGSVFIMYTAYRGMDQPWRTLSCLFYVLIALIIVASMTHQKTNFAYRVTQIGIEHCEWKNPPKWALIFLKWMTAITAIIFLYLAASDPGFLLGALVGPGGMGLIYLSMANSKRYQEMHTEYHHLVFQWEHFTQLAIATNREVLDLKFTLFDQRLGRTVRWSLNMFCERNQKENIANLIKPKLPPGTPFIRAKVNVPLSTD
ncbi:hypothetical protein ACW9H6_28860 [Pseudomonas sp. SDO528_S397]